MTRLLNVVVVFLILVPLLLAFPSTSLGATTNNARDGLHPINIISTTVAVQFLRQTTSAYAVDHRFVSSVVSQPTSAAVQSSFMTGEYDFGVGQRKRNTQKEGVRDRGLCALTHSPKKRTVMVRHREIIPYVDTSFDCLSLLIHFIHFIFTSHIPHHPFSLSRSARLDFARRFVFRSFSIES